MMKRALDLLVSSVTLCVLSPLLAAIGAAVWWQMGWPVLFTQIRPGLHGRPFRMIKFRTMTAQADAQGAPRPTPSG